MPATKNRPISAPFSARSTCSASARSTPTAPTYRDLRAFREEDQSLFFGRDAFANELVAAVDRQSFVAVVGASGSGKSSLVQAGLIPALAAVGWSAFCGPVRNPGTASPPACSN